MRILWFLWLPILRAAGVFATVNITCTRPDGAGAQIHSRLSVQAFASKAGFNYVSSPITELLPDNDGEKMNRWNLLIGPFRSFDLEVVKVRGLVQLFGEVLFRGKGKGGVLLDVDHCHFYTDYFPESLLQHRDEFRQKVSQAIKQWGLGGESYKERVAVHLRRGIIDDGSAGTRVTSDDDLLRHLTLIRQAHPNDDIRIYSYMENEALSSRLPTWASLDSNSDEFEMFAHCSQADVFVMAKSSLSYLAALANSNEVWYQDFWHPRINNWINL